jgi:hypothetical protein
MRRGESCFCSERRSSLCSVPTSSKRRRFEEMALLTGLLLCQGRSWRFKFLALSAERTSCIFSHGIT